MNENENTKPASKVALVSKLGLKCTLIAVLAALLLIPTCSVQSLIRERERAADDVIDEVSEQWCGKQTVVAPCLSVSKSFVVSPPVTSSSANAANDIKTRAIARRKLVIRFKDITPFSRYSLTRFVFISSICHFRLAIHLPSLS